MKLSVAGSAFHSLEFFRLVLIFSKDILRASTSGDLGAGDAGLAAAALTSGETFLAPSLQQGP